MSTRRVVDVDDDATWPRAVLELVTEWATRQRGATSVADLEIPSHVDQRLYELLDGSDVRAYHCTRLLDHERVDILSNGMQPLTRAATDQRIRRAHAVGAITDTDRDLYLESHLFNLRKEVSGIEQKEGRIWLFVPRALLDRDGQGLGELCANWGGEVLGQGLGFGNDERLARLGRPAMIAINANIPANSDYLQTELITTFVGTALQLRGVGSEVDYKASIPAERIAAIWGPGDAEYDRHRVLPH